MSVKRAKRVGPSGKGRSWSGAMPSSDHEARERIMEAAVRCVSRLGLARANLEEIAREAGIVRRTLYAYFRGRDEILDAVSTRAGEDLIARLTERVERHSDPRDRFVEALVFSAREIPRVEALAINFRPDTRPSRDGRMRAFDRELVRRALALVIDGAPDLAVDEEELIEVSARLVASLVVVPSTDRSEEALRTFVARWYLPVLGLDREPRRRRGARRAASASSRPTD